MKPIRSSTKGTVAILACLLLAGCGNATVQTWELDSVIEGCKSHGGIHEIYAWVRTRAQCQDGFVVFAKRVEK